VSVSGSLIGGGNGAAGGGGVPSGPAGGGLSGTYPDPAVVDDGHSHTSATLPATMAPSAHKASHQDGGADEISVTGLSGLLADAQTPAVHATSHSSGGPDAVTHNNLAGLTTGDPHTQYAALAGRSGGTVQNGGTAAGDDFVLRPNSADATGFVSIQRGPDGGVIADFRDGYITLGRDVYPALSNRPFIFMTAVASATNPVFRPSDSDTSGLGRAGTGQLSLVAASAEVLRASSGVSGVSAGVNHLVPVEANVALAATPNTLSAMESGAVLTNEGATAENCHTLPTAAAGYRFTFICADADGIKISANTGDTIRHAATVSAPAGYIRTATIGDSITVVSINATEWFVVSVIGTWTIDS